MHFTTRRFWEYYRALLKRRIDVAEIHRLILDVSPQNFEIIPIEKLIRHRLLANSRILLTLSHKISKRIICDRNLPVTICDRNAST
jgi:hypothetical protein